MAVNGCDSASWRWRVRAEHAVVASSAQVSRIKRALTKSDASTWNIEAWRRRDALAARLGAVAGIVGARWAWVVVRVYSASWAVVAWRALVIIHEVAGREERLGRRQRAEVTCRALEALSLHLVELEGSARARGRLMRSDRTVLALVAELVQFGRLSVLSLC
jgi:hypothetical protein